MTCLMADFVDCKVSEVSYKYFLIGQLVSISSKAAREGRDFLTLLPPHSKIEGPYTANGWITLAFSWGERLSDSTCPLDNQGIVAFGLIITGIKTLYVKYVKMRSTALGSWDSWILKGAWYTNDRWLWMVSFVVLAGWSGSALLPSTPSTIH